MLERGIEKVSGCVPPHVQVPFAPIYAFLDFTGLGGSLCLTPQYNMPSNFEYLSHFQCESISFQPSAVGRLPPAFRVENRGITHGIKFLPLSLTDLRSWLEFTCL